MTTETDSSVLTQSLAAAGRENLLGEKWLLAPSLRVGHQWIEAAARAGQPLIHVRVFTLQACALHLAASRMTQQQLTLVSGEEAALWVDAVWESMASGSGYLRLLPRSPGLCESVRGALEAVRLSGLDSGRLRQAAVESDKHLELADLMDAWLAELARHQLADYTHVLQLATHQAADSGWLSGELQVLLPEELEQWELERRLVAALGRRVRRLGADAAEQDRGTDASLLSWIAAPAEAPARHEDGTAGVFRAVGESNEVREVLRRVVAGGLSLDDVEVLHVDTDTYVPLLFEQSRRLLAQPGLQQGLPVTFAEGLPASYSRPGRALLLWLQWAAEGFPQRLATALIQEGLLDFSSSLTTRNNRRRLSLSWLSTLFRETPIGHGRQRHVQKLQEQLTALKEQRRRQSAEADSAAGSDASEGAAAQSAERLEQTRRRQLATRLLLRRLKALLFCTPYPDDPPAQVLEQAALFLLTQARAVGELDQVARDALLSRIGRMQQWLKSAGGANWSPWAWLRSLAGETRVLASGPRAGHLHVAHALAGGQSGRRHTFVLGLDDGRFPGAGLQDPVLLDDERLAISELLPRAADRLGQRAERLAQVLSGLRGRVCLSCSCRSLEDDREQFASSALLSAARILSSRSGEPPALEEPPHCFAPDAAAKAVDETEWWLWRLCGRGNSEPVAAQLDARFPHLARGRRARDARMGDSLTAYDGMAPAAGDDLSPFRADSRPWSASALETAGRCPLAFFFRYALAVKPFEELADEEDRWLDPLQFGLLLHEVFRAFMARLSASGRKPQFDRDQQLLAQLLTAEMRRFRELVPPPSESAFRQQSRLLLRSARIFLEQEEKHCRTRTPMFFEASLGLPAELLATALDTAEPVTVALGDGRQIRAVGRVDRVDQIGGAPEQQFEVWDYKTGSSASYEKSKPFDGGRRVQNVLYVAMVRRALRQQIDSAADVVRYGYFFPGAKSLGLRIDWAAAELESGLPVLQRLADVIASGAFLPTWDAKRDCAWCDYRSVCGETELFQLAEASQRKSAADKDGRTAAFQELRKK